MTKTDKSVFGTIAGALIAGSVLSAVAYFSPVEPLEIALTGPEKVSVGELIVLDVAATEADSYAYTVTPPLPCKLFNNGTALVCSTAADGEYLFVVAASDGGRIGLLEHVVTVGTPVPPGPLTFEQKLQRAVQQVQSADKETELAALANSFSTVASMVSAGVLRDVGEILDATLNLNKEALGDAREAWAPVRELLAEDLAGRELTTTEEHTTAWREIAEILKNGLSKKGL